MTQGVGTPIYMAPEMLRGEKRYTRAVDVFSFGIMCVELWNEKLPYSEVQFDNMVAFVMHVMGNNLPKIRDDCPYDLVILITECCAADKTIRPSFTTLLKDLVPIVDTAKSSVKDADHVHCRKNQS